MSKLDIADLTLEDREKVLRLLYAKISNTNTGITTKLPAHSFQIKIQNAKNQTQQKINKH